MLGVGNVANTRSGGHTLNARQRATSESQRPTSPTELPDSEAAVAVIGNPLSAQEAYQDERNADGQSSATQSTKQTAAAIRKTLEEFEQLVEGIMTGRFSAHEFPINWKLKPTRFAAMEPPGAVSIPTSADY